MSVRERIRSAAETLREPRSVNWISEQADAAWSTINEEHQDLVEQGQLRRAEAGETTRYQPDYTRLLFEEIRTLIKENTREELRKELGAITEDIEAWQVTYDVDTWEELEQSLADGDLARAELRGRRDVITDGRIAALDATTGDRRWSEQIATPDECCPDIQGTPTVVDGCLYVPGITEELVAADTADGTILWRTTVVDDDYGNAIPSPAVTAETAYVNTHHGGLVAIDIADGSIRWHSAENGDNQPPAAGDGGVVVPRSDSVVAYETSDSRAWTIEITVPDIGMAGYVMDTEVALAHGMCYVGVADGRIYAIGSRE